MSDTKVIYTGEWPKPFSAFRKKMLDWLTANGIDPMDLLMGDPIEIEGDTIHYLKYRYRDDKPCLGPDGSLATELASTPLTVPWED